MQRIRFRQSLVTLVAITLALGIGRKAYRARKIDVIFSDAELEEKWKAVD